MANDDIRELLKNNGVPYWKIADALGVSENTFGRMMRKQLGDDDRRAVVEALRHIVDERICYDD